MRTSLLRNPRLAAALIAVAMVLPRLAAAQSLRPLGNVTIPQIIGRVIGAILGLLGSIAILMIVYGGFTWMTSQGEAEKIKKAKNTIVYAILGLIIATMSYVIVNELIFNIFAPQVINPEGGSTVQ